MLAPIIVRSDDPRAAELAALGWVVAERSWATELPHFDEPVLQESVTQLSAGGLIEPGSDQVLRGGRQPARRDAASE